MSWKQKIDLETSPNDSVSELPYDSKKSPYLLSGYKLVIAEVTFMMMASLLGLDMSILDTALIAITSEFKAVDDIAWISSSYFISQACFVLLYGKILTFTRPKVVLFIALSIFLGGSLVCGAAPNIQVLLLGRGIAGLGAAGILVAILSIITQISTLSQRSILIGVTIAVYAGSVLIAPVIGGVFTERINFRWCFYINLPIGGIAMAALLLFVPNVPSSVTHDSAKSYLHSLLTMDWIGAFLNISGVLLVLTGLQLGGNTKPWSDPAVIATLVIGGVLSCLFIVWEARVGSRALLPVTLLKNRNVLGSFLTSLFTRWSIIVAALYLSLYYQLRGMSAIRAGVQLLPTSAACIVGTILSGFVVGRTRNVWPWMFFPPFLAAIAFSLLSTALNATTSLVLLAECQILIGFGLGPASQNCVLVAQGEFIDDEDMIPQATSLISFSTVLSAAIGSSVGGAIFQGTLESQIDRLDIKLPAEIRALVLESIEAVLELPAAYRSPVINAYMTALSRNFLTLIVISALAGLLVLLIEQKRLPEPPSSSSS